MAASNTKDCFRECIGKKVVGVLFDALPLNRADLSGGNKTLLFDDGSALTIASNGSFWQESPTDVERAIEGKQSELAALSRDLRDVIELAGRAVPRG